MAKITYSGKNSEILALWLQENADPDDYEISCDKIGNITGIEIKGINVIPRNILFELMGVKQKGIMETSE